jgi:hypothetical protein
VQKWYDLIVEAKDSTHKKTPVSTNKQNSAR